LSILGGAIQVRDRLELNFSARRTTFEAGIPVMRTALVGACGAALTMLCGGLQVSAQELRIETAEQNEALTVNASAVMQVRLATAWSVISDYDHLADFVPDIQSSRVLQRDGNQVLLEQKGNLGFLFFRQAIEVRLAVTEWPQQRIAAHDQRQSQADERQLYPGNPSRRPGTLGLQRSPGPLSLSRRWSANR
jgi:hypothetical protein